MTEHGEPGQTIRCTVDGALREATVSARVGLAEFLTDTGTPVHVGCGTGACGVCVVRVDGTPRRACTLLAVQVDGCRVETVRGLAGDEAMAVVRHVMSHRSAVQCGYCSPAFALTLHELSGRTGPCSVRAELSEVTCRCTGYTGLAAAATDLTAGTPPEPAGDLRRVEDGRLLFGAGDFVASRTCHGQVFARFVRSPHAHAGITAVDVSAARAMAGVVAVLTAADLPADAASLHPAPDAGRAEPTLAATEVRYVGQPVAMVVAETPQTAEDAADRVHVEYTPRIPRLTAAIGSAPDIVPGREQRAGSDVDDLLASAAVVLDERFTVPRQTGIPLEPRGLLAAYGPDGRLTVWGSTKQPHAHRDRLAAALGLPPEQVRMAPGDVGGAFGVKGELYPEDILVPLAATVCSRPVKWVEDRDEHLVSINHSRQQSWHVRIGADADGRLLGARVGIASDAGAYLRPLTTLVPDLAAAMFPGPYRFRGYHATVHSVLTNKTPTGPLRAPGRFEANFVRERALDMLAARLDMPPAELRRRNLLTAEELPYNAGTHGEGPVVYEAGDFLAAFEHALTLLPPQPPGDDRLRRGQAVVPFVELTSLGGTERASVTTMDGGRVRVEVASAPSGQGHQTAWAAVAAEVLDIPPADVEVVCGDTDSVACGLGTFASRSAVMVGNAVAAAATELRSKFGSVAQAGAGLTVEAAFTSDAHTCTYGALACAVAVDPELLTVQVEDLAIVCDAGTTIDEHLVVGQLIGGVAQGVGGALLEEITYDDAGRPTAAGIDGYLLPLAADLPDIWVELTNHHPPLTNPLGVKGVGEAGIAAAGAAVAAAVCAAVPELNRTLTGLPLSPSRLLAALPGAPPWPSGGPQYEEDHDA